MHVIHVYLMYHFLRACSQNSLLHMKVSNSDFSSLNSLTSRFELAGIFGKIINVSSI